MLMVIAKFVIFLWVAGYLPKLASEMLTTRTPPCWDNSRRAQGYVDIWMPDGMPIPFLSARRLYATFFFVLNGGCAFLIALALVGEIRGLFH